MSIYDQTTRAGNPRNPALALYGFWLSVLRNYYPPDPNTGRLPEKAIQFGRQPYWGIGVCGHDSNDRPILAYGPIYYGDRVGTTFKINASGEFQLWSMYGWQQRNHIAKETFVCWSYFRGYQWYVDTGSSEGSYGDRACQDWQKPRHYVSEDVMRTRMWRTNKPWLKLVRNQGEWCISFSRDDGALDGAPSRNIGPPTREQFDRYEALRQRRYRLMERDWGIAEGVIPPDARHARRTIQQHREDREKTIANIIAHLDVSTPARTVPLRKTPEEEGLWQAQHGCR